MAEEKAEEKREENIQTAHTKAFMTNLLRDVAVFTDFANETKGRLQFDTGKEIGLRLQEYEKMIRKIKGFIVPDYTKILRDLFGLCRDKFLELKNVNEYIMGELADATHIDLPKKWDVVDKPIKEKFQEMCTTIEELRKENENLRDKVEEFEIVCGGVAGVKKNLSNAESLIREQEEKIKALEKKLNATSAKLRDREEN